MTNDTQYNNQQENGSPPSANGLKTETKCEDAEDCELPASVLVDTLTGSH